MMQCAVTRRRLSGRKKANLVHGPRNPGLATLIGSPGLVHCEAPHSYQLLDANAADNIHEKDAANGAEKMGDGRRKRRYGEGSLNAGPLQRVCLANNVRHYPYSKVAEIREARRASLDRKIVTRKHIAPPTSLPLSPLDRQRVVPEMLTADDATGKFAYISLDGRLINAELATSATKIGGGLGVEEAKAWDDFAPMYRVLIVALSAAASSAAKDKNSLEIQRLLRIVTEQEKELVLMRQQLSEQLCSQDNTDPTSLALRTEPLEWASATGAAGNFQGSKPSRSPELGDVGCVEGEDTDTNAEVPGRADTNSPVNFRLNSPSPVDLGLALRDCVVLSKDLEITRDDAMNKDVVLLDTSFRKDLTSGDLSSLRETNSLLEKRADDEETWYVNPMVDAAEDYYDMCTPERLSPLFSTCTSAIQRSFELTALRSSIKKGDRRNSASRLYPLTEFSPASPLQVIPCRLSKESVTPVLEDRCIEEEVTALRVECAAAVLKLKTKVMTVLRKEGARCITERNISATEGKALVASLLSAVASCWRDTVPQALAALGLSPSEYNSCLLNKTQRKKPNVFECARDTDGWRQFLEEHDTNEQEVEQQSNRIAALCLCASNFEQLSVCTSSKDEVRDESPERESPKRESMYLLCAPEADEESSSSLVKVHTVQGGGDESNSRSSDLYSENSAESQSKFISCWESPAEWLDKASAEVADMEMQMKRLQQDVSEYEAERHNFASKLTENIYLENQVKLHGDIVELGARLQMKEFQIAEIKGPIQMKRNQEAGIVDLLEMRRELQWKESKIAELTTVVQSKERVIADLVNYKANMHADLEEMARQLQSKEYNILELKSQVQLKGLEVADLERTVKAKQNLDVSEMTQQIQLIESKFVELTTRLHLKDVEIADFERAQKVILLAKDEELSALREDRVLSDAHLDEVAAAAQATEIAYSDRISALEDLCSRKDYKIFELKQQLRALEAKINKFKPMQSPAMPRGKRSFVSYVPPPICEREVASSDSQKQHVLEKTLPPSSSKMEGPVVQHLVLKDTSFDEQDSSIHSQSPVEVSDHRLSGDEFHQEKNLTSTSTSSDREIQSDLEEFNQIVIDDKENDTKTELCNLYDDKILRTSINGVQSAKPRTLNNVITKSKRGTADPCRVSTSSIGNVGARNRVQASMTFTSAANPKPGSKNVSKSVANPVVIRKRVTISPRRLGQANVKVLSSMPLNTTVRNPKTFLIDQKHAVNPLVGDGVSADARTKENSAVKRRRWAG